MKHRRKHKLQTSSQLSRPELLESRKLFSATEASSSDGPALEIEQVLDVGRDYLLNLDAREHLTVSGKRFGSKNIGLPGGGRASSILPGGFRVLGAEAREDSFALHTEKDGTKYRWRGSSDGNLLSSFSGLSNFDNPSLLRATESPSQEEDSDNVQNQFPIILDSSIAAQQPLLTIQGDDFSYEQQLNDDVVQFLDTELVSGRYVISITADNFRVSKSFELEVRDDGTVLMNGNENEVVRFTGYEPTDYHFHYIWEANLNGSGGLEFSSHTDDNPITNQATNAAASLAALPENVEPLNNINSLKQNEFEVLNLSPDFTKPGMIKRMEVIVEGASDEDKQIIIYIDIDERLGKDASATTGWINFSCGRASHLRQADDTGFRLRATEFVHKREPIGELLLERIRLFDSHGHESIQTGEDIPFVCRFNNSVGVTIAPELVGNPTSAEFTDDYIFTMSFQVILETDECLLYRTYYEAEVPFQVKQDGRWILGGSAGATSTRRSKAELIGETEDGRWLFNVTFEGNVTRGRYDEFTTREIRIWDGKYFDLRFSPITVFKEPPPIEPLPPQFPPGFEQETLVVQAEPINQITPDGSTRVTMSFRGRDIQEIKAIISNPLQKQFQFFNANHFMLFHNYRTIGYTERGLPILEPVPWGIISSNISPENVMTLEVVESYAEGWNDYKAVFELPAESLPGTWKIEGLSFWGTRGGKSYRFSETSFST